MTFPKELTTVTPLSKSLAVALFLVFPLIGFLLALLFFGGYYFGIYQGKKENVLSSKNKNSYGSTFQEILADRCRVIQARPNNILRQIAQNDLPFKIDTKVIKINYKSEIDNPITYPIVCDPGGGSSDPNKNLGHYSLIINNTMGQKIFAYDHHSHGDISYPYNITVNGLGEDEDETIFKYNSKSNFGIFRENDTRMSIFLQSGFGGWGSTLNGSSVTVAGTKWLELPDGGIYYIRVEKEAIPSNDPRLIAILTKYSNGNWVANWTTIQKEIRNTFFKVNFINLLDEDINSTDNIKNPEKDNVLLTQTSINAFSAK